MNYASNITIGVGLVFLLIGVLPVTATSEVPAATAVPLSEDVATAGTVIVYDSETDTHTAGNTETAEQFFGVVSERPVLFLETATATVPVVMRGVTPVRVDGSNGAIERGDVLQLSEVSGVAELADSEAEHVFAVALESGPTATGEEGNILADVGVATAEARQQQLQVQDGVATPEGETTRTAGEIAATTARITVSLAIAVASLGFILYTFRSIWISGVTAVGRNPRARSSVLLMSIGSSVLILILAGFMVLVALGVLVIDF